MLTKLLNYSLLAFILFLCTACPYESDVPVEVAKNPINETILGRWKESTEQGVDYFEITKFNDKQYNITNYTKNEEKLEFKTETYLAHVSQVEGVDFINIISTKEPTFTIISGKKRTFSIYKMVLASDKKTMTLFPLSEHIREKFTTSKELQNFISKYKDLSFFYGTEIIYVR